MTLDSDHSVLPIIFRFEVKMNPGTPDHLYQALKNELSSRGLDLKEEDGQYVMEVKTIQLRG
jgi:hypothetical protein